MHKLIVGSAVVVAGSFSSVYGDPFQECPGEAFLFQKNPVQIYSVELLTGRFDLLQDDAGMPGNINGVGFSFDDGYLYGFNTSQYEVVQLDKNFKAKTLPVDGLPSNVTFYVGDVSDRYYWLYRKGTGLYRIHLDESADKYLQAEQVGDENASLTLTDFAFHPSTGELYAIDNKSGYLYRLNINNGELDDDSQFEFVGDAGITGTFGAAYFDVEGYFYVSRNSDGHVYRVDLTNPKQAETQARFFAYGPSSSQNDGARCAFASVRSTRVDWGDAPDSYGTTLTENGPRHGFDDSLYFGTELTDGEYYAAAYPASDDNDLFDDEDGIRWQSEWQAGLHQELLLSVVGSGYANVWIDWNGNGRFDEQTEHAIRNQRLASGEHRIPVLIPNDAVIGDTWLRARISSDEGLQPTGGAVDGEVEDHLISIQPTALTKRYFPSAAGWATLAFEDRWPQAGDYDFNDVVLNYRIVETWQGSNALRTDITIQIKALGASYRSGFAVHLPGFDSSQINVQELFISTPAGAYFSPQSLDAEHSILEVSDDLLAATGVGCAFYQTSGSCSDDNIHELTLSVPMVSGTPVTQLPAFPYNPFIFGSDEHWRGELVAPVEKQRVEVHLVDFAATTRAEASLWLQGDDDSYPELSRYYRTDGNLPWALIFGEDWQYPKEGVSILQAYPAFQRWAESNGSEQVDWYLKQNAVTEMLYGENQ
ncbi:LruC domain-containing protein [Reinekea marinisedimentorum]|uniref:LruC domain-containing protein n=1 Tax=Reinekea marinisedimentorum TaxID=230495 RepID=A0A4R3I8F0_9GAMM|nr:LruC domain-containing protein [Reinekea marinisedimentorum]TCS42394.1 LruC domain-containing protein [Reinekea marinisedimentorum]